MNSPDEVLAFEAADMAEQVGLDTDTEPAYVRHTFLSTLDTHELAWAAGFFDGEGCTTTATVRSRVRTYPVPRIIVAQRTPALLDRFRCAVGNLGRVRDRSPWHEPYQLWDFLSTKWWEAQAIIAMLWPFLGSTKREQATRVFLRWKEYTKESPYRKQECIHGHSFLDPSNVYMHTRTDGYTRRFCRECQAARSRLYRARQRGSHD